MVLVVSCRSVVTCGRDSHLIYIYLLPPTMSLGSSLVQYHPTVPSTKNTGHIADFFNFSSSTGQFLQNSKSPSMSLLQQELGTWTSHLYIMEWTSVRYSWQLKIRIWVTFHSIHHPGDCWQFHRTMAPLQVHLQCLEIINNYLNSTANKYCDQYREILAHIATIVRFSTTLHSYRLKTVSYVPNYKQERMLFLYDLTMYY